MFSRRLRHQARHELHDSVEYARKHECVNGRGHVDAATGRERQEHTGGQDKKQNGCSDEKSEHLLYALDFTFGSGGGGCKILMSQENIDA